MKISDKITPEVIQGSVKMLAPYVDGLTGKTLLAALRLYLPTESSAFRSAISAKQEEIIVLLKKRNEELKEDNERLFAQAELDTKISRNFVSLGRRFVREFSKLARSRDRLFALALAKGATVDEALETQDGKSGKK